MPNKILIELDEALAWARGERRMEVRLPDGTSAEMSVIEYRSAYQTQERLRPHRGKPGTADARVSSGQA